MKPPPNSDVIVAEANMLARAARRLGLRVRGQGRFHDLGRWWPFLELEADDNAQAIAFLNAASQLDATHHDVLELALHLRHAHPELGDFLRAVHTLVHQSVRFVREREERFQHALYTLRRGAGDCDDHARLVAALAIAGGARARVVGVKNSRGLVAHVAPALFDGLRWQWAETTVRARFGEAPRAAALRLGVVRPDIWTPTRKDTAA